MELAEIDVGRRRRIPTVTVKYVEGVDDHDVTLIMDNGCLRIEQNYIYDMNKRWAKPYKPYRAE